MPYDAKLGVTLVQSTENSPVRSDETVQEARDREGVVEAYELADNDDGYHCVIITEHPTHAEREKIHERIHELEEEAEDEPKVSQTETDPVESYLDEKRAEAQAASEELHKELQNLPSIVSGEGRRLVGDIRRDEPVHEVAWSPGHEGGDGHAHGAPASR